ncbi:MAG TPA: type I-MYXAN CRISPR-associated protein Cas6/Cmx6 [Gammaproteobacteria bacterium]|nr:type I-MYXAN CRISPR-associated protein Cas6/Cmx6 [Gammaproteobacteria bacterium]
MFWQEDTDTQKDQLKTQVLDLGFSFTCRQLPLDHAASLAEAVLAILPWLEHEPMAGIHSIHVAATANGWSRPETVLQLSRRARLYLRIPQHRQRDVLALSDQQLQINDDTMTIGTARPRAIQPLSCLHAYHVVTEVGESESAFMQRVADDLSTHNITVRKMLCGLTSTVQSKIGPLATRSVMIADLKAQESLALQSLVVGRGRLLGCGLFIPHKDIKAVNATVK